MGTLNVAFDGCHRLQVIDHCGREVAFDSLADVAQYATDRGFSKVEIDAATLARFAPQALAV
jgi:uncharacterized ParB-like nuclease family protein